MNQEVYLLFLSKRCSFERSLYKPKIVDTSEMTTPKMDRDKMYTGLDLHATCIEV